MNIQIYIGIVFLINLFISDGPAFILLKIKKNYNRIYAFAGVLIIEFILFTLPRILGASASSLTFILSYSTTFIWCILLFDDPIWKRLLAWANICLTPLFVDLTSIGLIVFFLGGSFDDVYTQNTYFLAGTVYTNMLYLTVDILFILLWQRFIDKKKTTHIILYLVLSFYQLVLLTIFLVISKDYATDMLWIGLLFIFSDIFIDIIIYYFFRQMEQKTYAEAKLSSLYFERESVNEYMIAEKQNMAKLETLQKEFLEQIHKTLEVIQANQQGSTVTEVLMQSEMILEKAKQEFYSPNPVLNALFTVKSHHARKLGIDISINCLHDPGLKIDELDLCSVVGNLMDNAIEACKNPHCSPKTVHAHVTQKANYCIIKIENSVGLDFTMPSSSHKTSKPDIINHGIGLKLVEQICIQYGGSFLLEPLSYNMVRATAILNEKAAL